MTPLPANAAETGAPVSSTGPATDAQWDRAWEGCDHATFFHSRAWSESWSTYRHDMEPDPILVEFEDGRQAVLPFTRQARVGGMAGVHQSSPAGTFGGWVSADDLTADHARALASILLEDLPGIQWRLNPYDPHVHDLDLPLDDGHTRVLRLDDDFEGIKSRWSKGHRYNDRRAKREGVEARLADSEEDWRAYYDAYMASVERWDDPSMIHGWDLFEALRTRDHDGIRLWVATHEDEVVSGALVLEAGGHAAYWHGASTLEGLDLHASNRVLGEAIEDACARGLRWFDFNPSGGHEGVEKFKARFGTETAPCGRTDRLPKMVEVAQQVDSVVSKAENFFS